MTHIQNNSGSWAGKRLSGASFAAALMIATVGGASAASLDPRDLEIDQAMGVLRMDPVLVRLLSEPPRPWPGPRGAQPFRQQPPAAQDDFSPTAPGAADRKPTFGP